MEKVVIRSGVKSFRRPTGAVVGGSVETSTVRRVVRTDTIQGVLSDK